jgi:HPt (histidine-containing phosphotransfer) domain-containing protein
MAVESIKSEPILDADGALARFGGDKDLFLEMSGILLEDAPQLIDDLGRAVKANNAGDVRMRAHAVKGLFLGCGGMRAAHVAQQLENAGQSFDLGHASELFSKLTTEVDALTHALQQYRA